MNLKVAHLIAVQFGIFIGIVICLVFSRFEYARPRTAAERRELATDRAAAGERMSEPEDDNRGDLEPAEPLTDEPATAMPNEYSPEAVEKSRALLAKLYYEQIAPKRHASSIPANTAVAPAYTEVAQEPEVVQAEEPAPQTVIYQQPTQVIVYPPPAQFVVFSHPRRFVNRCRPAPHPNALASSPHWRRDNGGTHLNGLPDSRHTRSFGLEQRRTTGVPTCPSTQGFTPRGKR